MSTDTMIETRELHTHYGQSHILHGVSFSIARGEAVGLLGRNGMGKTTLIRTILGLVRASSGSVKVAGRQVTRETPDRIVRLGLGYVPEGRGVFATLSVRENLVMAARPGLKGQRDWTFERVMDTFPRLRERVDHPGGQLSGGEQQMVSIGRALMTNPDLIVLDEATEGLAPLIVAEIWRIVGLVRASGIASLVVDRNFRSVLAHTDRCVVLQKGRLVLDAASDRLAADEGQLQQLLGV
jgi:branched-chain amino acid transport system ATP-binding protein